MVTQSDSQTSFLAPPLGDVHRRILEIEGLEKLKVSIVLRTVGSVNHCSWLSVFATLEGGQGRRRWYPRRNRGSMNRTSKEARARRKAGD